MQFAALASGVDGPGALRKCDLRRRLTSPRSPQLQKLPIGDNGSDPRQRRRIKDRREEAITRQNEQLMNSELQNQQQQCRERFLGRWYHIRQLYAVVSETMAARSENMLNRRKLPTSTVGAASTSTSAKTTEPLTPAPLHSLTAMPWLIDVARELRHGFASYQVTMPQLEIAIGSVLHLTLSSARNAISTAQIASSLRNVFQAFQHQPAVSTIDYRELLSALFVLDRWREDEKKMVARWFHEFAFPLTENSAAIGDIKMAVRGFDLQRMLFTACGDEMDESKMQPSALRKRRLECASKGLLGFGVHANLGNDSQDGRFLCDIENSSAEATRISEDVPQRSTLQLGDAVSGTIFMFVKSATGARGPPIMKVFLRQFDDGHSKPKHVVSTVTSLQWYFSLTSTEKLFVVIRSCMDTWLAHKRRQDEVVAADIRGRQLQQDLILLQQLEAERTLMEVEDKLSAVVEARALESDEMGRRRSFIAATDRVNANRKMQKQKEERIQYKTSRELAAELETKQAWAAIAEQVAAEVRAATLTWLDTVEAKEHINTETTRIFETDAKWIRNELDRDPDNAPFRIMPRGCRWQVFLEAPHGTVTRRLTKAFYLNTVTYEKYWCDEVVIEECEGIAREVIIQGRIDDALARLNAKEAEWALQRRQNTAATRIQMMLRCRQAQSVCRRIIRNTFIKRIDPSSGEIIYFNLARPQEVRLRPPTLIGSDEPLIPVESSTWVYRQDIHGGGYYERIDTGETSAGPPDYYILCTRCSVNFVTRRKISSGARYCIGCYANFRYAARRVTATVEEDSGWTKMPVQPANCMVCRNAAAHFVCTDCKHDATCTRCFNAVHGRLAKNKAHTPPIALVSRLSE
ncbi:hypothetical protein ON010_g7089 [Phytophthora cinnamomi]|nr:hypothetical protein ON010_g7089 [Phytophthora cinnamomi]